VATSVIILERPKAEQHALKSATLKDETGALLCLSSCDIMELKSSKTIQGVAGA